MDSVEQPLQHVDRHGTAVDEAVAFYEHVYGSQDIHIGDAATEGFSWRYRAVGDGDVTVGTSSVAARRWGTIDPADDYVLAWASAPGIRLDTGSSAPVDMLPGVPVMYPAGRDFTFSAAPTVQHLIRFDRSFLESVAAARQGDLPAPLQFARQPDPDALRQLRAVIATAAGALLDPATDRDRRSVLNTTVAEAVAATFDARPVPPSGLLSDGPATMRLAQEWMVANARRPITITDVSVAAGVAVRSLQASFRRHTGSSPMHFLRQVRLHRVRAELSAADPDTTTVAQIAVGWGVGHLGRFSGTYAATFGEPPSATLRRRRSA
ncbi:helix-turn-helix domain-containing protein [Curtobacterium sp. MCLR17_032]|uniref:AraC family transcriptional regulator n=1 Tax=Curtobacterium sp. MCLR17_032 TaxID=2175650 RepID=UPI000DA9FE39|nr:helix-turn-helix domain-containing protein [Curtobacterium sp. MCLR17_032]WIE62298.1 helix-turn-helix domain-containing protein [Curtobacterium sp. MCLR17_032]